MEMFGLTMHIDRLTQRGPGEVDGTSIVTDVVVTQSAMMADVGDFRAAPGNGIPVNSI